MMLLAGMLGRQSSSSPSPSSCGMLIDIAVASRTRESGKSFLLPHTIYTGARGMRQ
jgi:hypothetical protein